MPWINEVEMAKSIDDLLTSQSSTRRVYPNFDTLDARKEAHLEEQNSQKEDWVLRGIQIAKMIYEYFQVTGTHEYILDFSHLMSVTLRGDDVQGCDTRWDEVLLSTEEVPSQSSGSFPIHSLQVASYVSSSSFPCPD